MNEDTCAETEGRRKPWSYLDCFGGLTLDLMGHAGGLVHGSGPWTAHDPRWSWGRTGDQVSSTGLEQGLLL